MSRLLEILGVLAIFLLLLGPALLFGQYWLALVFLVFGVCFGTIELVAVKTTGSSVSQMFWKWSKDNKVRAFIILGCMLIAWILLLQHLGGKYLWSL